MKIVNHNGINMVGENIKFERIRRVSGYLVGTLDRFNNAKFAEVRDRVKHSTAITPAIDLHSISI